MPEQAQAGTEATKTNGKKWPDFNQKVADALFAKHGNISQTMRAMAKEGKEKGYIAAVLGKKYQHVYNVLTNDLKAAEAKKAEAKDAKK